MAGQGKRRLCVRKNVGSKPELRRPFGGKTEAFIRPDHVAVRITSRTVVQGPPPQDRPGLPGCGMMTADMREKEVPSSRERTDPRLRVTDPAFAPCLEVFKPKFLLGIRVARCEAGLSYA